MHLVILTFLMFQTSKPVTLQWDPPPAADLLIIHSARIYDTLAPAAPVQVAEVQCTINTYPTPNVCPVTVTFTATIGTKHNWTARFWDGFQETADSNVVATPPGIPKNVRTP